LRVCVNSQNKLLLMSSPASKSYQPQIKTDDDLSYSKSLLLRIALLSHLSTLFLSILASRLLTTDTIDFPWYWLYLNYILGAFHATFIHWSGHHHWSGRWFHAHTVEHHIELYPPKRYLGDEEVGAKDANAKYYSGVLLSPIILSAYWFGITAFLPIIVTFIFCGSWLKTVDWFHTQYHLNGSILEGYEWFAVLRELHYLHHTGSMLRNFGVTDFFVDFLLGNLAF